ncbi:hypothetical protein KNV07_gp068 [Vibrio phage Cody]|uniref:Uncharacterized protein n=4 Tax=Thalassavirus TaxID=2948922 RepID=A0A6M9Z1K1_9CAUD|nr:hypothetical protein KNU88_gp068 [Vibrio phage Chester]YP_010108304.1 hypothetical protein KNV07_gp068 [Vibrio phage Cody]YP_010108498.1 hypothetical protein KNV08_gp070 [Vibrio phage Quinn]YP_010114239.1 hypothetical protein KNV71_gp069 [Vibrio phage Gary]QIG66190.1 hypothetical protein CILSICK_69 [Vibrio phage Cilsick]QKN84536.1 hypothetical protein BBMUFFIN_70 [Vibrio phage BBMuffin]QQO89704.1 hypothetical protein GRLPWR_69 [Vibrio phage GRLPWR]QQO89902.1 hypothetical protein ABURR_67 
MKLSNGLLVSLRSGVYAEDVKDAFNFLAADSDGEVFAFDDKPYLPKVPPEHCQMHVWDTLEGDMEYIGDVVMPKDATYEQTLETLTEI